MHKWQVAVATNHPKLLYLIVELLKELEVSFVICPPECPETTNASIVMTTAEEVSQSPLENKLILDVGFNPDLIGIELRSRLSGIETPTTAFIGIDPGMSYGIALVLQGVPIFQRVHKSPHEAGKLVLALAGYVHTLFPQCKTVVRIGRGSRVFMALLLRELETHQDTIRIELVNEDHTTLSGGHNADAVSALIIAGRLGRPVTDHDLVITDKSGNIRIIKNLVSRLTQGQREITTDEARAVIAGDMSLTSVLDIS
ncbi:MAG: hypothetical protein ACP6KW_07735 [Candidatus Thorarchaeota archaeon]